MKYFKTPKFLFEVLGEKQTILEVTCTIIFALLGTGAVYLISDIHLSNWKAVLGVLLIGDILAGCLANFSFGTNEYYAKRPNNRLIFIAIHIHILVIAWLLSQPFHDALVVWAYTIISAFIVNALNGRTIQVFIAANFMCFGMFLLIFLSLPTWFFIVCMFFMIKVLFSFSVNHYGN
ncbi:hypothetical protein [Thalassotalea ganghwensis]